MSRGVKSVCIWPGPAGPKITCSIIFRITIVVLIIQLHDSLAHKSHHSRDPWQSLNVNPLDDRDSTTSDGYKKSSVHKFRYPQIELSIKRNEQRISKMSSKAHQDIVGTRTPTAPAVRSGDIGPGSETSGDGKDESIFIPNIPEHCKHALICRDKSSYPVKDVEKLVKDFTDIQVLARADKLSVADKISDQNSTSLCSFAEDLWEPISVRRAKNDTWHLVVQTDNMFKQSIRVVECLTANDPCGDIDRRNIWGLRTYRFATCKQQYVYQLMVVIHPVTKKIIADLFPVPSGCCCHLETNRTPKSI